MSNYRANSNNWFMTKWRGLGMRGKMYKFWSAVLQLFRTVALSSIVLASVSLSTDVWVVRSAVAATNPALKLSVSGARKTKAGVSLANINIKLANSGAGLQSSKLRLFFHDVQDRELHTSDIKVETRVAGVWKDVPVELIDGGVMGAIGAEGQSYSDRHQRGGFAIGKKANKTWPLRVTFRLPGLYSVIAAVSPNNGEIQLAKPVSFSVEVL